MEIKIKNYSSLNYDIKKFLEGGAAPAPAEDPNAATAAPEGTPEGGGDPMQQLAEIFMQGLLNQDCNLLAQGAQMFLQAFQGQGGAPAAPEGEQPVYRKGGKLSRWIKK